MSWTHTTIRLCLLLLALGLTPFVAGQQASPGTTPAISGTGTTNFIPIWSNSTTLGNSTLFETAGKVGIGNTSPAGTLDVTGGTIFRGLVQLPITAAATATVGKNSQPLDLAASAFNSSIATAINQHFRWQAEPVGNNTASPSGKLNLLFAPGAAVPAETGVSFSNGGIFTAKRLISTIATGTAPFTVASTTQVTNLNASLLDGLASTAFARLGVANTFTTSQSITGNLKVTGTYSGNGSGVTNVNATLLDGLTPGAFALVGSSNTFTYPQTINSSLTVSGGETLSTSIQYTDTGVAGQLESPLLINAIDCCDFGNRMIWAHSPSFPEWGVYYDDSLDVMHGQQSVTGFQPMTVAFGTGDVDVAGTLTAATKDFKIDHPLDPQNSLLYHSSVESSEMMNIYSGNLLLDSNGEGVVSMPKWFEALNTDFRYQLTAIGEAAQICT